MSGAKSPKSRPRNSNAERFVYCLCVDIVGSTQAGLQMDSRQRNEFNKLIIEYVQPYLAEFELDDALQKFTGDGWLIMRPGEESVPLSCTRCFRRLGAELMEGAPLAGRGDVGGLVAYSDQ